MTTAPTKIRVNVYVTPEQKELFDLEAKRLGKTRSVLIRCLSLHRIANAD